LFTAKYYRPDYLTVGIYAHSRGGGAARHRYGNPQSPAGRGDHRNTADHRVLGQAVVDAVRDAANRWVFRDLDLEPRDGVRHVAVSGSPQATHAVDITDTPELSIASLREHAAYLAASGRDMADAAAFPRRTASMTGQRFGGRPAAGFELLAM
jgi:LmbE family N-acetylglucosaminyl deacetylase